MFIFNYGKYLHKYQFTTFTVIYILWKNHERGAMDFQKIVNMKNRF